MCEQINHGILVTEIAKVLYVSVQKVYKVIEDYNKKGKYYKTNVKWGGRRKETSYLNLDSPI